MSHKGSVKGISSQGKRCEFSSTPLATEQVIHQELYFNDSCLLTAGQIVHNKFQIDKHFHFEFSIILPWINDALNSNVNPNWYKALHISYLNQFSASSLSPMWVLICLMVSGIHSSDNLFLKHLIKARGINSDPPCWSMNPLSEVQAKTTVCCTMDHLDCLKTHPRLASTSRLML